MLKVVRSTRIRAISGLSDIFQAAAMFVRVFTARYVVILEGGLNDAGARFKSRLVTEAMKQIKIASSEATKPRSRSRTGQLPLPSLFPPFSICRAICVELHRHVETRCACCDSSTSANRYQKQLASMQKFINLWIDHSFLSLFSFIVIFVTCDWHIPYYR